MNCVIISIGDELLSGRTVDTNSAWLSSQLYRLGIEVTERLTLPDNEARITEGIATAFQRANLVILTGGLGPTDDDRTRRAIADYLGVELETDPNILKTIRRKFSERNSEMPETAEREALVPTGAKPLNNSVGIAPGLYLKIGDDKHLVALPGVPKELKAIFENELSRTLKGAAGNEGRNRVVESFFTTGIPESILAKKIYDNLGKTHPKNLAFYPSSLGVEVRLTINPKSADDKHILSIIEQTAEPWCYSQEENSLPKIVGELLLEKGATLAIAESCTGGLLASRIVDISGASDWFAGGVVSYSNRAKAEILHVSTEALEKYGAVSPQVAAQMAEGAAEVFHADYALSTTGIAGPTGGTPEKPTGLVFYALHTPNGNLIRKNRFTAGREDHRLRTSQATLAMLWLYMMGKYQKHHWADGSEGC